MLIWLVMACSDPDFGHYGDSLQAYEDGRVAMTTGAPSVAAEAFSRAVQFDPSSEVLVVWHARALRASEQLGPALSVLNAGVRRFPSGHLVRYDRAAMRAKTGDLSGAAEDLRWLYANEKANPIVVGEDPDFLPLRTDPITKSLVPQAQVEATVESESDSVLVGDTHVLDFRITSRSGSLVEISRMQEGTEPLRVRRIVEDVIDEGPIWTRRRLRAEVLALRGGRTVLGPWLVQSAGTSVITEQVIVEAVELEGRASRFEDDGLSIELDMPSTRWAGQNPPHFERDGEGSWALIAADEHLRPLDAAVGVNMEVRRAGQPVWKAMRLAEREDVEIWGDGHLKARMD